MCRIVRRGPGSLARAQQGLLRLVVSPGILGRWENFTSVFHTGGRSEHIHKTLSRPSQLLHWFCSGLALDKLLCSCACISLHTDLGLHGKPCVKTCFLSTADQVFEHRHTWAPPVVTCILASSFTTSTATSPPLSSRRVFMLMRGLSCLRLPPHSSRFLLRPSRALELHQLHHPLDPPAIPSLDPRHRLLCSCGSGGASPAQSDSSSGFHLPRSSTWRMTRCILGHLCVLVVSSRLQSHHIRIYVFSYVNVQLVFLPTCNPYSSLVACSEHPRHSLPASFEMWSACSLFDEDLNPGFEHFKTRADFELPPAPKQGSAPPLVDP